MSRNFKWLKTQNMNNQLDFNICKYISLENEIYTEMIIKYSKYK